MIAYNLLFENDELVLLEDCSKYLAVKSLTNSAEEVINDLAEKGFFSTWKDRRFFYVDSGGMVDELACSRSGIFRRFQVHNLTVSNWCKRFVIDHRQLKVSIDPIIVKK